MAFDWDSIDTDVNPALARLEDYNSNAYNASTNPRGLGVGGHISQFPLAVDDVSVVANAFPAFADLMEGYADAADASATDSAAQAAKLTATSTTSVSLSIASGTEKTITTQASKLFAAGNFLLITSDANPTTHWMVIQVSSYSSTTLVGDIVAFRGSGSRADWTIRHAAFPGRSAGLSFVWSTDTNNSDPTTGKIKINHATVASATALYISETSRDAVAISTILARWGASTSTVKGTLVIAEPTAPTNFMSFEITSVRTDNGDWDTFTIQNGTGTAPAEGAIVHVFFAPTGDKGETGATGDAGSTGATGAAGADAGVELLLNTATSGDPGSGKFLFNNATFGSATAFHISETDNNSLSIAALLAAIDNGAGTNKILVYALKQGGGAFYSFYVTAALSDQGAYDTFAITPITSAGSPSNNDEFHFLFVPIEKGDTGSTGSTGSTGAQGAPTSLTWAFSTTTTDSDPGDNIFRLDNATIGSVTKAYIDNNGPGSQSAAAWLDSWDDSTNTTHRGTLVIIQASDASKWALFTVGAVTDDTGYRDVALTYVAGPGGFDNAATCVLSFFRTGNKGSDGAGSGDVVGPASATDNAIALYDGTTGELIKDSAVVQTTGVLSPATTDAVALGSTSKMWSDLFLASGAVINADNGNAVITHSSGIWTVSTGDLRVTTAGTNTASVVTVGGTQTLTNKTLTAPVVNSPTGIVKGDVGLGNVDNTSDANKPVSTAAQTLLDLKRIVRVRAATTGNVTIATALNNGDSLDGLTLATGELVAVVAQTSPAENGIFVVGPSPARHTDLDAFADYPGLLVIVQEGSTNADSMWLCTSDAGGTIDSSALTFVQQGGPSTVTGRALLNAADAAAAKTTLSLNNVDNTSDTTKDAAATTLSNKTLTAPKFANNGYIADANGNESVVFGTTASAVNEVKVTNAATGANPQISGQGGDTDVGLDFLVKGAGKYNFKASASGPAEIRLWEDADNGSNYAGIIAQASMAANRTLTLPDQSGTVAVTADFVGKQAIPVPATAMIAATTNGAASGTVETSTNKVMLATLDFDASTAEIAQFSIAMPEQWDEGTVTFKVHWSHPSTTTNFGVAWDLAGVAFGDDDAQDAAFGTAVVVTDTGGTTNDLYITAESSAVTIAGTPQAGDLVYFRLRRAPSNGSDTMAVDARAHAVVVYINTAAGKDG